MPLINKTQIIDKVKTAIVSIHDKHIDDVVIGDYADATELLIDYRPIEFSEKHPPKPQLEGDRLLALGQRKADKKLGILLSGASDYQIISDDLNKVLPVLDVIVIDFHGFRDGRGYSLAQEIVQHSAFHDNLTLRASGDILPDTLQLLAEVGFSEFQIDNKEFDDSWFGYFDGIKHGYTGRDVGQLPMFAK
ncbi:MULTISPECIES: DUF934 domain-containing protein [unclassified Moraxella]|uniref:DUF934 domain-containing protein n=1 Tax=unclassified Moraxella TaxID=2685852 RepID=UPI003AF47EB1